MMDNTKCPFCHIDREVIISSDLCFSIYDNYPVNKGHVLVIPKRHVSDYFDLEQDDIDSLWKQVKEIKNFLDGKYQPDGYNIGFNAGRSAGQTIDHVHIHVIPRYTGDMDDPTGGVRHVIPGKGKYKVKPEEIKTGPMEYDNKTPAQTKTGITMQIPAVLVLRHFWGNSHHLASRLYV